MDPTHPTTGKNLLHEILTVLAVYIRTQFLIFILISLIFWILLSALGIAYAPVIAFLTGSLSLVPFIGMTSAAIIASVIAVLDRNSFLNPAYPIIEGVAVFILYLVLNQLIDFLLVPYMIGKTMKIRPLVILLTVTAATWIFGVAGTFLALPTLLVMHTIYKHFSAHHSPPS